MHTSLLPQGREYGLATDLLRIAALELKEVRSSDLDHRVSNFGPTRTSKPVSLDERGSSSLQGKVVESAKQINGNVTPGEENKGKRKRTASSKAKELGVEVLGDVSNVKEARKSKRVEEKGDGEPNPKRRKDKHQAAPLVQPTETSRAYETPREEELSNQLKEAQKEIKHLKGLLTSSDMRAKRKIEDLERAVRELTQITNDLRAAPHLDERIAKLEKHCRFYATKLTQKERANAIQEREITELKERLENEQETGDYKSQIAVEGMKILKEAIAELESRDREDRTASSTGETVPFEGSESETDSINKRFLNYCAVYQQYIREGEDFPHSQVGE